MLVLSCFAIYALVCMLITASALITGFDEVVSRIPPETTYCVFIEGLIFVVLISPVSIPVTVIRVVRQLWREAGNQCQSLEEDRL